MLPVLSAGVAIAQGSQSVVGISLAQLAGRSPTPSRRDGSSLRHIGSGTTPMLTATIGTMPMAMIPTGAMPMASVLSLLSQP